MTSRNEEGACECLCECISPMTQVWYFDEQRVWTSSFNLTVFSSFALRINTPSGRICPLANIWIVHCFDTTPSPCGSWVARVIRDAFCVDSSLLHLRVRRGSRNQKFLIEMRRNANAVQMKCLLPWVLLRLPDANSIRWPCQMTMSWVRMGAVRIFGEG